MYLFTGLGELLVWVDKEVPLFSYYLRCIICDLSLSECVVFVVLFSDLEF